MLRRHIHKSFLHHTTNMHNNDNPQDLPSDNTPSQMNGNASDSTPSQMNGDVSDSTPSQMHGDASDSTPSQMNGDISDSTPSKIRGEEANIGEEAKQDDERSENSQIPDSGLISDSGLIADSGLIEETAPVAEQPKADYQLLYTTAYHQIYSIVGEGRRYILKAIKPSAGDLRRQESLLKREYTLLSQLECPYIVRVWKLRNDPKVGPAIVMEYVDGLQLDKWLKTKPTKAQKQQILSELLEAIQYLHNKEIVHSDLKPQNILVAGNHVKLLDVGFSDKDEFTQSNIGYTPTYAAPEQIKGGTTDSRTDIYAIGALIRLLFPHDYRLVVRRCMRTNPQKRYASIADIQQAMHATSIGKRIGGILCLVLLLIGSLILLFTPKMGSSDTAEALASDTIEATTADTVFISTPDTVFIPMQQENTSLAQPIIRRDTIIQRVADSIAKTTVIQHDTVFIMDSIAYQRQKAAEKARYQKQLAEQLELSEKWFQPHADTLHFMYQNDLKNDPYGQYYEVAQIFAEFYKLNFRLLVAKTLEIYPQYDPEVCEIMSGAYSTAIHQYITWETDKRESFSDLHETIDSDFANHISQLNDSLRVYRQHVDSIITEEEFLDHLQLFQAYERSYQAQKEADARREALQQRLLDE